MKHLKEQTISNKRIFNGQFLKVDQDQVKAPDGQIYVREYIVHPGAAMVIPVLENGNVVMIKQYRHAVKKVFMEFPAGKRDHGEETIVTAKRELQEETGYVAQNLQLLTTIHPVIGYSDEFIDIYLATNLTRTNLSLDHGEFLEVFDISPHEVMKNLFDGNLTDVKTQIGAFWLDKIIRKDWAFANIPSR